MATHALTKGSEEAKQFGSTVKQIREKLGLSQAELAEMYVRADGSHPHVSFITNLERGEGSVPREFVEQLAKRAEVDGPQELLPVGVSLDELRQAYKPRGMETPATPRRRRAAARRPRAVQTPAKVLNGNGAHTAGPASRKDANGAVSIKQEGDKIVIEIDLVTAVHATLAAR